MNWSLGSAAGGATCCPPSASRLLNGGESRAAGGRRNAMHATGHHHQGGDAAAAAARVRRPAVDPGIWDRISGGGRNWCPELVVWTTHRTASSAWASGAGRTWES